MDKILVRFFLISMVLCLISLVLSFFQIRELNAKIALQNKVNQELVYRNASIQADLNDFQNGTEAVYERARNQLGMIKNDEIFVQVMDQPISEIVPIHSIQPPETQIQNSQERMAAQTEKSATDNPKAASVKTEGKEQEISPPSIPAVPVTPAPNK